jgi:phenylalanyl-tRNA synthetase beta chain
MLSAVIKNQNANFYEIKGIIEQLAKDLGVKNLSFKKSVKSGVGASIYIEKEYLGEIEVLDNNLIDFELNFQTLLKYANANKIFKAFAKYPPIMEDLSIVVGDDIKTENLINEIKAQDKLIVDVSLKDSFENSRTFHIVYQDPDKNLTNEEVSKITQKIINSITSKFKAAFKN